jgi:hypothetical protein
MIRKSSRVLVPYRVLPSLWVISYHPQGKTYIHMEASAHSDFCLTLTLDHIFWKQPVEDFFALSWPGCYRPHRNAQRATRQFVRILTYRWSFWWEGATEERGNKRSLVQNCRPSRNIRFPAEQVPAMTNNLNIELETQQIRERYSRVIEQWLNSNFCSLTGRKGEIREKETA